MKSLAQHLTESLDSTDNIVVGVKESARKSFLKDLDQNKVKYTHVNGNQYSIENTPKCRMAIQMAKERHGQNAIKIITTD